MPIQDYRRHHRAESSELSVGLYDEGRRLQAVSMNDLSLSGMGISVPDRLEEGQELDYNVILPGGEIKGRAVVRWVQPFDLGYRSGIEFKDVGFWDKRRLGKYTGEGMDTPIPPAITRFCDNLLMIATLTVVGLVVKEGLGLSFQDIQDLIIFYVWV